jgi:hypothetical protein
MAGEYCEFIDTVKCSDYSVSRDTVKCVDPGGMILVGRNKVKLKINQSKILLVFHSH